MPRKLTIAVLLLSVASCLSQEEYLRPTFPDVFQTEIEGTFLEENGAFEIDASMYFDRKNNRAALHVTKDSDLTRLVFNFDNDETLSINGYECEPASIPEEQGMFPFSLVNGKKIMAPAEEAFFFTKSVLQRQSLAESNIPTLVYEVTLDIPQYEQKNCNVKHIFSKPDFQLATCKEGLFCNSTLITISVRCHDDNGKIKMDHVYRFSRFKFEIEDESVFQPPPGTYCKMTNAKNIPSLPSYFSFTYDIITKPKRGKDDAAIFNTHKEIWFDTEYKIIRVDEFDYSDLLISSRIFDFKADSAFIIIATVPQCDLDPITDDMKLEDITRLPKAIFAQNGSIGEDSTAVYVGKRRVHGLNYDVWSLEWKNRETGSKVVEDVYFLQIGPNKELSLNGGPKELYTQISHVDVYMYQMNYELNEYELSALKYFDINDFKANPKEWSAFDVSACFDNEHKKEFAIKIEKFPLVEGTHLYRGILETFYNKIVEVTGVSILRISRLTGVFDGLYLTGLRGFILDNSKDAGWPVDSKEPGMEETFKQLMKAASENMLSFKFEGIDIKANSSIIDKQTDTIVEGNCTIVENNCTIIENNCTIVENNCTIVEVGCNCTNVEVNDTIVEGNCTIVEVGCNCTNVEVNASTTTVIETSKSTGNCFSGGSMAASSLVLFAIGITFGVAGYYVFLKKRRARNDFVQMQEIDS